MRHPLYAPVVAASTVLAALLLASPALAVTVLDEDFTGGSAGFGYLDDAFRGTSQPAYATGSYSGSGD